MTDAVGTEFTTLDLELDELSAPKPAVWLRAVEHTRFPALLAARLPNVVHARRVLEWGDEHQFIDTATAAAVRYCLRMNERGIVATVEEGRPVGLWDQIVAVCRQWEADGRPDPRERS